MHVVFFLIKDLFLSYLAQYNRYWMCSEAWILLSTPSDSKMKMCPERFSATFRMTFWKMILESSKNSIAWNWWSWSVATTRLGKSSRATEHTSKCTGPDRNVPNNRNVYVISPAHFLCVISVVILYNCIHAVAQCCCILCCRVYTLFYMYSWAVPTNASTFTTNDAMERTLILSSS